ncbi:transcription factor IIF subunit tfg1 [Batrachochytrium dendrobatidis]|nr:transcription factor IIF subunit tfg1 [Batrachochytrium dendrobatidis]
MKLGCWNTNKYLSDILLLSSVVNSTGFGMNNGNRKVDGGRDGQQQTQNPMYQNAMQQVISHLLSQGLTPAQAQQQAHAYVQQNLQQLISQQQHAQGQHQQAISQQQQQSATLPESTTEAQRKVQQQPVQQIPAVQPVATYETHRLIAAGAGVMPHHIMKVPNPKFDLKSFKAPVTMVRQDPYKIRQEQYRLDAIRQGKEFKAAGRGDNQIDGNIGLGGINISLDKDKIAPFGNAAKQKQNLFKKKTRTYYLSRDHEDAGNSDRLGDTDMILTSVNARHGDPDRHPWVLQDDDDQYYTGNLEGSQGSNYMLFVFVNGGFKVIPATKFYKFMPRVNYRTLTVDEAEEQMKTKTRSKVSSHSDRWVMRNKEGIDGEKSMSLMDKLRNNIIDDEPKHAVVKTKREAEPGLDYTEEFADDEEINFGIDDAEDAKDAARRMFGEDRANQRFEDEEDVDAELDNLRKGKVAKKIAKSLVKHEKNDVYEMDEENPYVSDEEEDEELNEMEEQKDEKAAQQQAIAAKKEADLIMKIRRDVSGSSTKLQRSGSISGTQSPRVASPTSPSSQPSATSPLSNTSTANGKNRPKSGGSTPGPASSSEIKRRRESSVSTGMTGQNSPPPPPAPAQVIARELEKQKEQRSKKRARMSIASQGDAPSSPFNPTQHQSSSKPSSRPQSSSPASPHNSQVRQPTPRSISHSSAASPSALSVPGSPPRSGDSENTGAVLTEEHIIRVIQAKKGAPITVKDIVAHVRNFLQSNPTNKDLLRQIMRRVVVHDKETGIVTLKDEFKGKY